MSSTEGHTAQTPQRRPIAPLQNGMLFHAITNPGRGVDMEQIHFELREAADPQRLLAAWNEVTAVHDILRTAFTWEDVSEPMQVVSDECVVPMQLLDWSDLSAEDQAAARRALLAEDRLADFDLRTPPLQRLHLVRLADDHWWGLWTFHHALLDGRSFPLVLQEIMDWYDDGTAPGSRPSYQRFVDHLRSLDHSGAESFWRAHLDGIEPATPIKVDVDEAPTSAPWAGVAERFLDAETTLALNEGATAADVSLNNLVQAAWALLIHRYEANISDGRADVVFGTTRACRHLTAEAADTIGLLINTVPLRVTVDRSEPVADLAAKLRARQRELRSVEATPLHLINSWAGVPAGGDLFETLVVFDDASLDARMAGHAPGRDRSYVYEGQTNYPITLLAYGDDRLHLRIEHSTERLSDAAAARMADQLVTVLGAMADDLTAEVGSIAYLTDADTKLLESWNDTAVDYDLDRTLVDLFEAQVERTPDAIALQFGDDTVSYAEFNARANALARALRARGVGPESVVGIYAERSIELLVAVHGIHKAGGAYLPLDPEYPDDRLQFMVGDAGCALAIAAGGTVDSSGRLGVDVLDLDDASNLAGLPTTNPDRLAGPDNAAYVIYTSGSTGQPKGVINEHRGIVNRLLWKQDAFGLDASDVVLQKTPFTFDVSVWELLWPFQHGARLAIAAPGGHRDTSYLASEIARTGVTTLHFVPSMLALFVEEPKLDDCDTIRRVICSGEALPRDLQDRLFARLSGSRRPRLHNLYGPTEAAIDVTWWECDPESSLPYIPIGSAIANTSMRVLDPDLQPAPPGAPGELHIGGTQVSRGYLNRPELNAERFIADPFGDPGDRLYKTGDLGRYRADGSLEYLGRTDHQVKIRGFRIELGEIEVVLSAHPAVAHCVVVDLEVRAGDRQLVAYLVAAADVDDAELRRFLGESLTDYMIPSAFVRLDELPLSTAGKIDRKRLPKPEFGRPAGDDVPKSDTERRVAALWADLLEVEQVDRSTPFFEAGGHSLLAIRLAARLGQEFGRDMSVTDFLSHPTVATQAEFLTATPAADRSEDLARNAGDMAAKRRAAAQRRQAARRPGPAGARGGRDSGPRGGRRR